MRQPVKTVEERFWPKVEKTDGCWLWRGCILKTGYGAFYLKKNGVRKSMRAHRVAYELVVGPIADGLTLDHLCRVTTCVNPQHLEPVTLAENIRRAVRPTCKRGHPKVAGDRQCRTCQAPFAAAAKKRYAEKNADALREYYRLRACAKRAKAREAKGEWP